MVGAVRSGILRVGMNLRIDRAGSSVGPPGGVLVTKIVPHIPHRTELYRGQYAKKVDEVGPGIQLAVGIRGISHKELLAGDVLRD